MTSYGNRSFQIYLRFSNEIFLNLEWALSPRIGATERERGGRFDHTDRRHAEMEADLCYAAVVETEECREPPHATRR